MRDRRGSGHFARIIGLITFQDTRELGNIPTDLSAIVGTQPINFQNRSTDKGMGGNQTPPSIQFNFNHREQWFNMSFIRFS